MLKTELFMHCDYKTRDRFSCSEGWRALGFKQRERFVRE